MQQLKFPIMYFIHMYENRIMKPIKIVLKEGKGNEKVIEGDAFDQSTSCASVEISQ
jgi:predicted DNA-binding antitoxin AbrB/MazE fold protein